MQKMLLLSIVFATFAIPIWAARERSPAKAFKKVVFYIIAFNFFYLLALRFLYFKLF